MSQLLAKILIIPVRMYQLILSPLLSSVLGAKCRYEPSCSQYMIESLKEWGAGKGLLLGTKRICRCHPWGDFGPDPVPKNPKKN